MATCDLWIKTNQNFNQVLTTADLSEKYRRSCKKTWIQPWNTEQYELELKIIEKELKLSIEQLKSYVLQCEVYFARLERETHEEFQKWCLKLKQDTADAKYAVVETNGIQGEFICNGTEYGTNKNTYVTRDDELCDNSIFMHTNENRIENHTYFAENKQVVNVLVLIRRIK